MGFPITIESDIDIDIDIDLDLDRGIDSGGASGATVAPVRLGIGRGSRWIAVAGGLGYFPIAPGTAGSFGGVLLFLVAMHQGIDLSRPHFLGLYSLAVGLLLVLGVRAAGRAEIDFGRRDDGRIVIDEVVGQMITLLPLTLLPRADFSLLFPHVVTGFVLFRLFDVWKPGAVRWAEQRFKGGLGVMLDDVVAGLYAGLCLSIYLIVYLRVWASA